MTSDVQVKSITLQLALYVVHYRNNLQSYLIPITEKYNDNVMLKEAELWDRWVVSRISRNYASYISGHISPYWILPSFSPLVQPMQLSKKNIYILSQAYTHNVRCARISICCCQFWFCVANNGAWCNLHILLYSMFLFCWSFADSKIVALLEINTMAV